MANFLDDSALRARYHHPKPIYLTEEEIAAWFEKEAEYIRELMHRA